jgi:excisionase family DNA binding protein
MDALKRETVPLIRAAELCGVSRRTVYNWLASGKIQAVRTAGGAVRVFTDSLFKPLGDIKLNGRKNG